MNRRAVTLPELLLVVVLISILTGIGVPRLTATANRAALRQARHQVVRGLDASRGAAVRLGQPVDLSVVEGGLVITQAADPAPIWQAPGPGLAGVALTGLVTPIRFGPSGITTGASNRTLRLRKGGDSLDVVVSRLGRVRL